jgi:hypothetical protein
LKNAINEKYFQLPDHVYIAVPEFIVTRNFALHQLRHHRVLFPVLLRLPDVPAPGM